MADRGRGLLLRLLVAHRLLTRNAMRMPFANWSSGGLLNPYGSTRFACADEQYCEG